MDPVAMCFPAEGWWYVMAMHDDSWAVGAGGESGGCVRRPRDLDGSDRAEESIVRASELN